MVDQSVGRSVGMVGRYGWSVSWSAWSVHMVDRLVGMFGRCDQLVGWSVGRSTIWSAIRSTIRSAIWSVDWLAGQSVGRSIGMVGRYGRLVGWSVGRQSVGWLVGQSNDVHKLLLRDNSTGC